MVATDGSSLAKAATDKLRKRFPFGTWQAVAEEKSVSYCGKDMSLQGDGLDRWISLSQNTFIDGRLDEISVSKGRRNSLEEFATEDERTDSVVL